MGDEVPVEDPVEQVIGHGAEPEVEEVIFPPPPNPATIDVAVEPVEESVDVDLPINPRSNLLNAVLRSVGGSVVLTDADLAEDVEPAMVTIYRTGDQVTVHLSGTPEPDHVLMHRVAALHEQAAAAEHAGLLLADAQEEARQQIAAAKLAADQQRAEALPGVRPAIRPSGEVRQIPPRRRK